MAESSKEDDPIEGAEPGSRSRDGAAELDAAECGDQEYGGGREHASGTRFADDLASASPRGGSTAALIASAQSLARVLGAVTAAMQPPRLVVGLLLAAALMSAGRAWDVFARPSVPVGGFGVRAASPDVEVRKPFDATLDATVEGVQAVARGVVTFEPVAVANAFAELFLGIPMGLWRHDPLFLFGFGILFVALTALFGGALARMAACDLAGAERLGVEGGVGFAASCWRSMALAPIAPLLIALLMWAIVAVIGVALRWPWIELFGAILHGPALVLGALVAISLLGYAVAFPLLVPAVACERCDAGEAQQRAFAYLFQRPARLAASMVLGIIGFGIGYLVVAGVAAATLQVTAWGLAATAGDAASRLPEGYGPFTLTPDAVATAEGVSATLADGIIGLWRTVLMGLVAGWVFSYYYAASTTIYLGLRESADGQEPAEIWRPGMVHGAFVLTGDDAERRATIRTLDARWRATLAWIARRRGGRRDDERA